MPTRTGRCPWGVDETALAERAERWREMEAAVLVLKSDTGI